MSMRMLVTGRGSIAGRHVRHLRELVPDVQLALLSGTGEVDAALHPCEVLADLDAGLRWKPDAVVIASASSRHAQELETCLQWGLPCLAEKPLVIARSELARIRAARDAASSTPVAVGCNLRHLPALRKLRDELQGGSLGKVVRAQLEVGQNLTQWRPARDLQSSYSAHAEQGGGVVFDLVHEIDLAHWLLGPLQVRAAIGGHFSSLQIAADDVHVALLQDAGGAPVVVGLDYVSQRPVRRYAIVAEGGTLVCDLMARRLSLGQREAVRMITDDPGDFDVEYTYRLQMMDWLAALRDPQHAVASPLADAFETTELMLAMKEAAP
ncbi:MAG: Gfo/Idh/MocA family protein [Burkholderiaceae bacterium]